MSNCIPKRRYYTWHSLCHCDDRLLENAGPDVQWQSSRTLLKQYSVVCRTRTLMQSRRVALLIKIIIVSKVFACHNNNTDTLHPLCVCWLYEEDISSPELVLSPSAPVLCLQYNPKDQSVLAGGQYNGQVVIWDLRKGNRPTEQTALPVSHRDPVYNVTWIQSKAGTECFSISTDGQVGQPHDRKSRRMRIRNLGKNMKEEEE